MPAEAGSNPVVWETGRLTRTINNVRTPPMFLGTRYFSGVERSQDHKIYFDKEKLDLRIMPYSAPDAPLQVAEAPGFSTDSVQAPYLGEKTPFYATDMVDRDMGEGLLGALSPAQRLQRKVGRELANKRRKMERGMEKARAEILKTSQLVVVGKNYPLATVDFKRPADQTNVNPTVPWTTPATATPTADLQEWAARVAKQTGIAPRECVMPLSTYNTLSATDEFIAKMNHRRIVQPDMQMGPIAQDEGEPIYVGRFGLFDLWIYDFPYVDWEGNEQQAFVDGDLLLMGNVEGVTQYASILDEHFNFGVIPFASRSWLTDDLPSVRFLSAQSANMPIPYRIEASLHADVNTAA